MKAFIAKNKWFVPTVIFVGVIGLSIGGYFVFRKKDEVNESEIPAEAKGLLDKIKELMNHPVVNAVAIANKVSELAKLGYTYDAKTGTILKADAATATGGANPPAPSPEPSEFVSVEASGYPTAKGKLLTTKAGARASNGAVETYSLTEIEVPDVSIIKHWEYVGKPLGLLYPKEKIAYLKRSDTLQWEKVKIADVMKRADPQMSGWFIIEKTWWGATPATGLPAEITGVKIWIPEN